MNNVFETKVLKFETKLFNFIDKYDDKLTRLITLCKKAFIVFLKGYELVFFNLISIFKATGLIMRYSTFPLHWIWIKMELRRPEGNITDLPNFQLGAHYIFGKPGAGKSTFTYHAMMDYARFTGKCSYTTEQMELPRKDVYGQEYYYHQLFEPSDFYQEGEQVNGFNSDRFNMVIYEEMLTKYQQRRNKEKSYNDEVLPMIAAMGTQRHQGIDLFYFISQLPRNDIAIMQMLVGYHEIQIKKAFDYKNWLNTGRIRFYIKGWWVESSKVQITSGNDYKLSKPYRWFYKNKYNDDLKYFNRLNMKADFDKLPKYQGREMKSI